MLRSINSNSTAAPLAPLSEAGLIADKLRPPLLSGLAKSEIDVVVAGATQRTCRRGTVLVREGEAADQLFMILSGRARYFILSKDGQRVLLHSILPGEIFGGMTFLPFPSTYLVSTEAVRDSELLVWTRDRIRHLGWRYPRLLENALVTASAYLEWYVTTHLLLVSHPAPQRLAHVVLELANDVGRPTENGIEIEITNEELADQANVTRFSASRLLARWQRGGLVTKQRNRIVVHAPDRLFSYDLPPRNQ